MVTDKPLRDFSTLGVGGPAQYFAHIENEGQLLDAYEFARGEALDILALGRGSNVLFSDEGFSGMALHMESRDLHLENDQLRVDAGVSVSELVFLGEKLGFTGYECFAGLPGTVGGAIYGNAGCYGKEFWDCVEEVRFFDGEFFQVQEKQPATGQFGYRWSFFKENPGYIVISAKLTVKPGDSKLVAAETKRIRQLRQASQPREKSAGCIFRNPLKNGRRISAGELIDKTGLKGYRVGHAEISEKHGNFFVNLGGAMANDFVDLIKTAKGRVLQKFNILLEEEIVRVGEF